MRNALSSSSAQLAPRKTSPPLAPWLGAAILALAFAALVIVISPYHNTPVQDDWDYARTASIFLNTGLFQRSELAQAAEVFSTVWGALFSKAFGFSFVTLRLSTLTLSLLAVLIFFALLGELGFDVPRRALGAATLMVSPLFIYLSFSFMTDVPMLFWEMSAMYLFARALRRGNPRLAFAASACASLALLTRQLGLMIAVASAVYFLARSPKARRLAFVAASLALPCLVAAVYAWWTAFGPGYNWANSQATAVGTLDFLLDTQMPGIVVRRVVIYLMTLALYLLPLWLAALAALAPALRVLGRATRVKRFFALLAGLVFAATILRLGLRGEWFPYLTDTFTRAGLRPYLAYFAVEFGARRPDLFPVPVWIALTVFAGLLGWGLAVIALDNTVHPSTAGQSPPIRLVYWMGICLSLPTLFFKGSFERYALPFLPIAIVLLLDATHRLRIDGKLAALGLAAMALFSIALMKDFWGWMDNRWAAAQALVRQGIPLEKLDGGYEWDGWNLYEESMEYVQRNHVPITFNPWEYVIDPKYIITFTGLRGYHLQREIDFNSPFGSDHGRIFILQRDPPRRVSKPY